eukprot:NODE_2000_length_1016_cov_333.785640.p1 GENE.NODE_2000_length_1016_cov_333.785640~~NODE_2000_length_1016_cov_333.785640.p1  ORF type:complete len:251 (+),score=86.74 NODE_2000_length_1016_cov_333.785640:121-873(+)
MSGTGFDHSTSTYSPEGRIFQVEYAMKAVENGSLALGVCCKDGAVLASIKTLHSKLLVNDTHRRIYRLDEHAGLVGVGLFADARAVMNHARQECIHYKSNYGVSIGGSVLADRLANMMHAYTLYWSVRPFGCAVLMAHRDPSTGKPSLYQITPDGVASKYFGVAIGGKDTPLAKTELEKMNFRDMSCEEVIPKLAKIILKAHQKTGDKKTQLEMGMITAANKAFTRVPQEDVDVVTKTAADELESEEDDE